jgi:hypothetical protein
VLTCRSLLAAAGIGLTFGGLAGWHLHTPPPPAPAVHAVEASATTASLAQHVEAGPERITVTEYLPGPVRLVPGPAVPGPERLVPVPGPERILRVTVTERGPVVTDTHATAASERRQELTVTPPPPVERPGWAVGAGLQLLPDQRLELALERRIVGPVWARAWALQPMALQPPAVGLGLRVEW